MVILYEQDNDSVSSQFYVILTLSSFSHSVYQFLFVKLSVK